MIVSAYLFPIFAIIILKTVLHFNGEWTVFLWLLLIGEATIGLLHLAAILCQTLQVEYLGSLVKSVHFEESWTELIETSQYKKDSKGNLYSSKSIKEKYHPEKYYFFTSRDTKFKTDISFYNYVLSQWQAEPNVCSWLGNNIKGGIRYGESCCTSLNEEAVFF